MKKILVRTLVLWLFASQSVVGHSQEATSRAQSFVSTQPNFTALVVVKTPEFPCALQYGAIARVGQTVRVDVRPFLAGREPQVACAPGGPEFGLIFRLNGPEGVDMVARFNHKKREVEMFDAQDSSSGGALDAVLFTPYGLLMGWGFDRSPIGRNARIDGEQSVDGYTCVVVVDEDADGNWARYYVAKSLKNLVIRIAWGHDGERSGGCGECPMDVLWRSGELSLTDITLDPPASVVDVPLGYQRRTARGSRQAPPN